MRKGDPEKNRRPDPVESLGLYERIKSKILKHQKT